MTDVVKLGPGAPVPALVKGARALLRQGRVAGALRACEWAIAQAPDNPEAHFHHGNALKADGQLDEAEIAYRRAATLAPNAAPVWHNLGGLLLASGRAEQAEDAFRKTLALDDRNPETHRNLGIALQAQDRLDDAIDAYGSALNRAPGWPSASSNLVQALLAADRAKEAVVICDEWLAANPGHVEGLALKCCCLNEAGDKKALGELLDFDRFVVERTIDAPQGYESIDAFNAALADFVLSHPTLKLPPESDPTYHHPKLHITDEILGESEGPMAALEKIMNDCVEDYWSRMGEDPSHPFLANKPESWKISAWSVVLQGEGNLVPHIHLDGYLGGSYYVKVPKDVMNKKKKQGWFELGRPPEELVLRKKPRVRALQPLPGKMLQFPGYFYHRTTPYQSAEGEIRITIAFDVVPT